MDLIHLKKKEFDKKVHWHLQKKKECCDHHCDESSSSSSHHCDESSSSSSHHGKPPKHQEHCVEDVLKAILHAQKKVQKKEKKHNNCDTSCKESIRQLLCESKKPKKNTIPFILYCGDCEPFKATGVTTFSCHSKKKKFACITSFIFRIKAISNNCAVLELLEIKSDKGHSSDKGKECKSKDVFSPCCQIDGKNVDNLEKTGICITVDLNCICAITCLPAVRL
ncbi:MAG: CotY/CotZ family spore coat protein [Bacillota bacterium]|nr:CotY/CotZ family spore coat protein [Bacillota bacterium]